MLIRFVVDAAYLLEPRGNLFRQPSGNGTAVRRPHAYIEAWCSEQEPNLAPDVVAVVAGRKLSAGSAGAGDVTAH